jgi:hypothetical protein
MFLILYLTPCPVWNHKVVAPQKAEILFGTCSGRERMLFTVCTKSLLEAGGSLTEPKKDRNRNAENCVIASN